MDQTGRDGVSAVGYMPANTLYHLAGAAIDGGEFVDKLTFSMAKRLGSRCANAGHSLQQRSVAGKAADIARTRRPSDWKRLSAGAGTKGPRLHDWCYLELADLEVEEFNSANQGLWTRGLLIRRHIADGDLAFFTTWCPAGTSIETLVAVEGHRWAIEDSFETAKNEFGLDQNESRSWHGWHGHVSLVMLAFAMMAVIRHRANPPPPKKTKRRTTAKTKS
jgi:SRSO17 transposase